MVTIIRSVRRDNFGNQVSGTEFDVAGCLVAPSLGAGQASSRELSGLTHTVVTGSQLYLPPGVDIRATDRVRIGGVLWDVEGDVGDWGSAGMQVSLKKASG